MVPFPTAQPPSVPPSALVSNNKGKPTPNSANSSQNSGYYSSSSLAAAHANNTANHLNGNTTTTLLNRRSRGDSIFNGKTSTSSRAPSVDEDDGFYDNIQAENRFSGVSMSEMDDTSLCSQIPPAQKSAGGRIGQLIRRIGGSSGISKPPVQSAASLVSLNKVSNDTLIHPQRHIGLMKSNSLSNEPWRIHAMGNNNTKEASTEGKSMGIGNRLKQTIFGSKKRLQT